MTIKKGLFFILAYGLIASTSYAATLSVLKSDINKIINKFDKNINIGLEVKDLTTNKIIFKRNENRYFVPASNLKLVTDAAALIYLGADHQFKTSFYTNAKVIKNGNLQGNIYIHFSGAPDLSFSELSHAVKSLKKLSISSIAGNVVLVGSQFSEQPYGPGWMVDDVRHSYGAPLTPYIINQNRFDLTISPGYKISKRSHIAIAQVEPVIGVINNIRTAASSEKCKIELELDEQNNLFANGCIKINSHTREENVSIVNTKKHAIDLARQAFKMAGLEVKGSFKVGKNELKSKRVATIKSVPLNNLIRQTLKPSDNLFADSIFLKIGQLYFKQKSSWSNASKAVKVILAKHTGINLSKAAIFDGSGLSRYNLITPHQLTSLLAFLHQQFPISYEFISALPIGGRDGTLKNRFLIGQQRAMVRAKTGSMLGVISLAGYLPTKNNHLLAFSMMINNISGQSSRSLYKYRRLEDQICQYLLKANLWKTILSPSKGKGKLLPFQQKQSESQKNKVDENRLRSLEWELRKSLKLYQVAIVRTSSSVILNSKANKKFDEHRLKILKNMMITRKIWALITTNNKKLISEIKSILPKSNYIINNVATDDKIHNYFEIKLFIS